MLFLSEIRQTHLSNFCWCTSVLAPLIRINKNKKLPSHLNVEFPFSLDLSQIKCLNDIKSPKSLLKLKKKVEKNLKIEEEGKLEKVESLNKLKKKVFMKLNKLKKKTSLRSNV